MGEGCRGRRGCPWGPPPTGSFLLYSGGCSPSPIQPSLAPGGHRGICRDSRSPQRRGRLQRGWVGHCHGLTAPTPPSSVLPPPPPASPPCNRVGVRGAMRNGQTPGDTAGFPLTPRGTHVYLEPGQMRTSLLLASFYPQTDKDGQGK